ncbi:hypothetical protein DM02DRAFT_675967 [Periconia macrospinosa]|uniref:Uncharacterized protein n=1 Tax=Periconia macrospinosa TaxID=97972 RepID=A0A2V1DB18_9PLEO|nr:hypothetical protein DM02DRAFT_675967 [Periconia macrospinosa]
MSCNAQKYPEIPDGCPICSIQSDIATIRQIQTIMTYRSGVFRSKQAALLENNHTISTPNELSIHYVVRNQWTTTKARLLNRIAAYENRLASLKLKAKKGLKVYYTKEIKDLEKALRIWDAEKEACATIPGVNDISTSSNIWSKISKLPIKDMVRGLKSLFFTRSKRSRPIPTTTPLIPPPPKPILKPPRSFERRSQQPQDPTTTNHLTPLLSPKKETRFSPLVQHSPPYLNTIISFDRNNDYIYTTLSTKPTVHLHNEYTFVDEPTHRPIARRSEDPASRGTWVSPQGWQKVNTSLSSVGWERAAEVMGWIFRKRDRDRGKKGEGRKGTRKMVAGFGWAVGKVVRRGRVDIEGKGEGKVQGDRRRER